MTAGGKPCGKVVVIQPTVPNYRIGFFERLAQRLGPRFVVHASPQDLGVLTERATRPAWERRLGPVRLLYFGLEWQEGVLSIPISEDDIVVVCGSPRSLSTLGLIAKCKLKRVRTIWWGHFWSSTSRQWRAAIRFALMRLPDAIVFYTDQEVAEYQSVYTSKNDKPVFALNNGIETDEISQLRVPYVAARRPRDVLFLGRITQKAKLELLLDALTNSACRNVTLDVIGSGDCESDLHQRCESLGIANRVIWHGGVTDEQVIAAVANDCKLFVYPGAVGLSLIHAFSYGLPSVVHDNRWEHMPEIAALHAGTNGFLFRQGDANSLAAVVVDALSSPERLSAMSAAAIDTTAQSYNAEDMTDRFCIAIRKVTGM